MFSQTVAKVIKITYSANLFTEKNALFKILFLFLSYFKGEAKGICFPFHAGQYAYGVVCGFDLCQKIGAFGEIVYAFLWHVERFVLLLHRRNMQVRYAMRLHFDMTQ